MSHGGKGHKRSGSTDGLELWKDSPEEHDFPAALSYLSLLMQEHEATELVDRLRTGAVTHRLAKDILRSSRLPILKPTNFHVAIDLAKIKRSERLSPVLLVRGNLTRGVPLTIADGYHRVCASYAISENASIPCIIVDG